MADIDISFLIRSAKDDVSQFVRLSEESYHDKVSAIAKRVLTDKRIRIILLAGPSGSGKTTTAKLLCEYIREGGMTCEVISLDDFYREAEDPRYPKLPCGELDRESPDALDFLQIKQTLTDVSSQRAFSVPKYDFKTASRVGFKVFEPICDGCVIIEGLHALNPKIFSHLPNKSQLKIFISVSTNIFDDEKQIISGKKLRFIRRMVRDSVHRAADAEKTFDMWQSVLRGEELYLYPCRKFADITFDTFHPYEPFVTRKFVLNQLHDDFAEKEPYIRDVLCGIKSFFDIPNSLIPENSLLREFIPSEES